MGSVSATPALPLAVARAGGHAMYPGLGLPPAAARAGARRARGRDRRVRRELHRADDGPRVARARRGARAVRRLLPRRPDPALVESCTRRRRCGWQVESAEEARAAEAAGCDLVIAKGWESGGRKRFEGPALLPLLDAVLGACRARDRRRRDRDRARRRGWSRPARRRRASARASSPPGVRRPPGVGARRLAAAPRTPSSARVQRRHPGRARTGPAPLDRRRRGPRGEQAGVCASRRGDSVARFAPMPPTRDSTGDRGDAVLRRAVGGRRPRDPAGRRDRRRALRARRGGVTAFLGARWYVIRRAVSGKPATYRCPLCGERFPAMVEHLLVTPEGDPQRRRHAHAECVRRARAAGRLPLREEVEPARPGWHARLRVPWRR